MTTRYEPETLTGQVQEAIHEEFAEDIDVEDAKHNGCIVSVHKSTSLIEDVTDVLESRGWTTGESFENIYGEKKLLVEDTNE